MQNRQSHSQSKHVHDRHSQTGFSVESYPFVHAANACSKEKWELRGGKRERKENVKKTNEPLHSKVNRTKPRE